MHASIATMRVPLRAPPPTSPLPTSALGTSTDSDRRQNCGVDHLPSAYLLHCAVDCCMQPTSRIASMRMPQSPSHGNHQRDAAPSTSSIRLRLPCLQIRPPHTLALGLVRAFWTQSKGCHLGPMLCATSRLGRRVLTGLLSCREAGDRAAASIADVPSHALCQFDDARPLSDA